ncbi:MAG: UDP-glucose 6-dehydrogenase [Treponema sp.]|nr:MAG: UDP-glucose 6-dehydrogenase [Treponema sp.]
MARIAIAGTGYVGLVSGACLADFGNKVVCVDNNAEKINTLNTGGIPIFEPGLDDFVERNVKDGRLSFTTDMKAAVENSDVIFIAVGTPPADDGSADLKYVEAVAREIAKNMNDYKVIVDKSTVPIGTGRRVESWIKDEFAKRNDGKQFDFDVVSNPEFLREGAAIQDFTHPDRVVIGVETEKATEIMKDVYRALYLSETPFVETNLETAEMIKYAANAFLAVKITYINEIANLCEKVGANVQDVAKAMGRDKRIGNKFLHPGPGYGGSCFPKDTRAIASIAEKNNSALSIVEAAITANENQKMLMFKKIVNTFGGKDKLKGMTFAVLGLAFKPNTDDMREAPALTILPELVKAGAKIKVTDPEAITEAVWRLEPYKESIEYFDDEYEMMQDADAVVLLTEWNQYRNLDLAKLKSSLKSKIFFDFRNVYHRSDMEKQGFKYIGVGT